MAKIKIPEKITENTNVDDALAYHLKKAEMHLITAVELFQKKNPPHRNVNYPERLIKAQEIVTALFREELVRIRGPIKVRIR